MDIIAEIGQAHDGSLGIAHSYIDAVAKAGVNAIKFQTHIAEAESSIHEEFRVNFSYEDKTRFDYWKRMQFTEEQWIQLKKHCDEVGLEFISSPFSNKAVELLERLGVKRYKIGSGEVSNLLMIDKISKTKKPIMISSGMSSYKELDKTISYIQAKVDDISLFQCTTSYPTKAGDWGVSLIPELSARYNLPIGFSDHSGDIYACMAATTLGAKLLEFHVVFDKKMFGPDSKSSLDISQIKKLVTGVNQIETELMSYNDLKANNSKFNNLKSIFEKSLAINKDLTKGSVIFFEDLEAKKPSNMGIKASEFQKVLGKKISVDLKQWEFLKWEHLI